MRILQVNGWLGRLNTPLGELIAQESADIVCLQEAFAPNSKPLNNFIDQYTYVDELIEMGKFAHSFFSPAWGFEMAGEIIQEGNIILSKYPLSDTQSFHTYDSYYIKTPADSRRINARVWQSCTVQTPGNKKLTVANYQGYLPASDPIGDETTIMTMKKVAAALVKLPKPLIFCTDLNISIKSPAYKAIGGAGLRNLTAENNVRTTLSEVHRAPNRNSVVCDYIFCSDEVQVKNFRLSDKIVSDHKALILDFDI